MPVFLGHIPAVLPHNNAQLRLGGGFLGLLPELVTPDEVPDVLKLEVQSVHNGEVYARNVVANMTHRPARL